VKKDNVIDLNVIDLPPDRVDILSEIDIADCFAEQHKNELRYVAKWGQWLRYDGTRWREEQTLKTFDMARRLCKELTLEINSKSEIKKVRSSKTVAAVIQLARADRRLAATFDQWDADPMVLNTPDGVVDLKTGDLKPHKPEDYMTKTTAIGPKKGECQLWTEFLKNFTCGAEDIQSYLKRLCGYSLTGDTSEEALFFLFGIGGNGKGVFIHTIAGIMHEYHRTAPMEVFIASSMDRHPTELAMLHGARLVTATETEEGKRWDEPRIEALTGRDPISARFMRQDFFEFVPQFKLAISGNHRPGLRTVDEAIRRRMNLIKCAARIPKDKIDTKLAEKLKAEWPGILKWMIDGCIEWQKNGLKPPAGVTAATDEYFETEDVFGGWLEECCVLGPNQTATSIELWGSWQTWAGRANEFIGVQKRFTQKLEDHGFKRDRVHDAEGKQQRGFRGLAVTM
jgi:putative DNA primase/helicase